MDMLFFMMGRVGVRCYSHDGAAAAAELLVVVRELLAVRRGGDDLVLEVARHFLRPVRGLDGGLERVAARIQAVELLDGLLDALEAAVRGRLGFGVRRQLRRRRLV